MIEFGRVIEVREGSFAKAASPIDVTEYVLPPSVMAEGIVTVVVLLVCPVTVAT